MELVMVSDSGRVTATEFRCQLETEVKAEEERPLAE